MAESNRWDLGIPSSGTGMHEGFIAPTNNPVRNYSDFAELQCVPATSIPQTMAEQMDGDQNTTWGPSGSSRRKR